MLFLIVSIVVLVLPAIHGISCRGGIDLDDGTEFENQRDDPNFFFDFDHRRISGRGLLDVEVGGESGGGTRCRWTIHPIPVADYIDLFFERIDLSGGWLELFEGKSENNWKSIIFFQTSVQNLPRPVRTSRGSDAVLILWYALGKGRSSVSFDLTYSATCLQSPSVGLVPAQKLVRLHPPWVPTIRSPDVDGRISPNLTYSYLISPIHNSFEGPITIMITDLFLPAADDNITVYDGTTEDAAVLAVLTGTVPPDQWIVATAGAALIVLRTDGDIEKIGYYGFSYLADGDSHECSPGGEILGGHTGVFTDGTRKL